MAESTKVDLRRLSAQIRRPVRIGMYESVLEIDVGDESATMKTECYDVRETHRELRIVRKGIRLYGWKKPEGDFIATQVRPWIPQGYVTVWDESFVPVIQHKQGKMYTFAEWREQVTFERDCYRPGASRFPIDSYQRVLEGSDCGEGSYNPPKMDKHWPIGVQQ